ncbi:MULTISPECIES: hypothetical protein [Novosphingobium]|uniref:hypothetical protein n=1 Tax=Novosphingobium TaxID=165696 RepID=UPI0012DD23B2|nr:MULTISPECIES: hypothetical protein [Novosphingobium]MBF7014134.1 hypothetical protein [Novosphingobium sp. HR1a]
MLADVDDAYRQRALPVDDSGENAAASDLLKIRELDLDRYGATKCLSPLAPRQDIVSLPKKPRFDFIAAK